MNNGRPHHITLHDKPLCTCPKALTAGFPCSCTSRKLTRAVAQRYCLKHYKFPGNEAIRVIEGECPVMLRPDQI